MRILSFYSWVGVISYRYTWIVCIVAAATLGFVHACSHCASGYQSGGKAVLQLALALRGFAKGYTPPLPFIIVSLAATGVVTIGLAHRAGGSQSPGASFPRITLLPFADLIV